MLSYRVNTRTLMNLHIQLNIIAEQTGVPIIFFHERYSERIASKVSGIKRKDINKYIDKEITFSKNVRSTIKTRHIKGYVFCKLDGSRFIDINGAFRTALKKAKITDFHFHDLRHTFASHWIMRGGSIKGLQQILGHADIKMTMRYSHLSKEFQKDEIKILEGLTGQAGKQNAQKKINC